MKPVNKGGSLLEPFGSNNPHGGRWNVRVILCCAIVAVCMVAMYFRCDQNVLLGDDLFYRYVLPAEELTTPNIGRQVTTISDALESQTNQYFHTNGRFPVHIAVQLLSGAYPSPAFPIVSALLIGAIMVSFVWLTIPKRSRQNPLWWTATALIWFYLFPSADHLWYEIATGMNYLLPMAMVLIWLLLWHKLSSGPRRQTALLILTTIIGILTGWSQEGFAVPLSGGMFVYAIFNRRTLPLSHWIPLICLWIGTAALVFAPGNHHRIGDGGGITGHILNGINLYFQIKILWIALIAVITALCLKKPKLVKHYREHSAIWFTCMIAILFGLVANTYVQSFTGIEFFSAIIVMGLLCQLLPDSDTPWQFNLQCITAALITIAFAWHQYVIIRASIQIKEAYLAFIDEYTRSDDGIMTLAPCDVTPIARRWVNMALRHDSEWALYSLSVAYAANKRPIIILSGDEKLLLTAPAEFFILPRLIPGTAKAYLCNKIWVKGSHSQPLKATLRRSNSQPTEKIINMLTNSAGKTFTTHIQPKQNVVIGDTDTFTLYLKPSFDIERIDFVE